MDSEGKVQPIETLTASQSLVESIDRANALVAAYGSLEVAAEEARSRELLAKIALSGAKPAAASRIAYEIDHAPHARDRLRAAEMAMWGEERAKAGTTAVQVNIGAIALALAKMDDGDEEPRIPTTPYVVRVGPIPGSEQSWVQCAVGAKDCIGEHHIDSDGVEWHRASQKSRYGRNEDGTLIDDLHT